MALSVILGELRLENFIFSVNTALPVLFVILIGLFLKRRGMLSEADVKVLDRFSFKVGLPLLMFHDISEMDVYSEFQLSFVLFCALFSIATFVIIWIVAMKVFPDRAMAGSFAQGSVRSSVAVLGVTIVSSIYGSAGIAALMIAAAVPVYNVMSVIILTFCGSGGKIGRDTIRSALRGIITNPLILGIVAGLPFALLRIELPTALSSAIGSLSSCATPLALIVIGASFSRSAAASSFRPALCASVIKLLLLPAIGLPIAVALGFRDAALTSILLMTGTATTPASFIMARNMGCDGPLAANIVLITDALFSITLTMWLFILKSLALI